MKPRVRGGMGELLYAIGLDAFALVGRLVIACAYQVMRRLR